MSVSTELLFRSPYISVFSSHQDIEGLNAATLLMSLVHCSKVLILCKVNNESKSLRLLCIVCIYTEGNVNNGNLAY